MQQSEPHTFMHHRVSSDGVQYCSPHFIFQKSCSITNKLTTNSFLIKKERKKERINKNKVKKRHLRYYIYRYTRHTFFRAQCTVEHLLLTLFVPKEGNKKGRKQGRKEVRNSQFAIRRLLACLLSPHNIYCRCIVYRIVYRTVL